MERFSDASFAEGKAMDSSVGAGEAVLGAGEALGAERAEDSGAVQTVRARLLDEMKRGLYRHADRLPSENVLAERLSISRTQLRDSLAQLEREGFITRRHGVGTLVNRHVLDVKVRTDIEVEFGDMIRLSGYEPDSRLTGFGFIWADGDTAKKLRLGSCGEVLAVTRLVFADNRPAIFCEDFLPASRVKRRDFGRAELEPPIFEFLKKHCGIEPYMDITELRPVAADARLAGLLDSAIGAPLLYMDEVDYDIDGAPVLYARQYYADGIIKHTLMRKKF